MTQQSKTATFASNIGSIVRKTIAGVGIMGGLLLVGGSDYNEESGRDNGPLNWAQFFTGVAAMGVGALALRKKDMESLVDHEADMTWDQVQAAHDHHESMKAYQDEMTGMLQNNNIRGKNTFKTQQPKAERQQQNLSGFPNTFKKGNNLG